LGGGNQGGVPEGHERRPGGVDKISYDRYGRFGEGWGSSPGDPTERLGV